MDHHYNCNYPSSFSSSLLEEIYRSFDDDNHGDYNDIKSYRKSSRMMMNKSSSCYLEREKKLPREERFRALDQWIDKYDSNNYNNKVNFRRNSMAEINSVQKKFSSSSSSSTSSSDSRFSSSESESIGSVKSKMKAKSLSLKPIRTNFDSSEFHRKSYSDEIPAKKKSSHGSKEGNLHKRALKLYGDLKKVKQPISPGGKLASFLNSLFNSTASKKPKISPATSVMTSSSSYGGEKFTASSSTPSTASSYARSCLSKTPSSAGRFERRSVRFCPVNTVISSTDNTNDCNFVSKLETHHHNNNNDGNEELKVKIMEKNRRVEEVAKELLKNYHHGRKYNQNDVINMINKSDNNTYKSKNNDKNIGKIRGFEMEDEDEDHDDDDDDVSCCSSDLFELENLLEIGVDGRYCEELPVYETTHVDTNRAIANGFIL